MIQQSWHSNGREVADAGSAVLASVRVGSSRSPAGVPVGWCWLLSLLLLVSPGCSIRKMAINKVGDALASGGTTFASDDDPELVKAAVPFSLKLMESLLAESPRHRGLLFAASSGFTQYAFAFVQQEADELEDSDLDAATAMKERARRLYLRARNYGLRGLETRHRGFAEALRKDPGLAVQTLREADIPTAYWTAVSWSAAISVKKDPELVGDLPIVGSLVDRLQALEEDYDHGAIHSFLIQFEMVRQGVGGDPVARAREHFRRAVELSDGQQAGPYVALAEAVAVPRQDRKEFELLLRQALDIDADARPEWRLANLILQRRARWLLDRADDLFIE